jgi:hypothetical protein
MKKLSLSLLVFFIAAYPTLGQSSQKTAGAPATPPKISQFLLYAERSIKLGEHNHMEDGDIGVRSVITSKPAAPQLLLNKHTKCRNLFAPSTTIDHDAEARDVLTDTLNRESDTEIKAQAKFPAADMPPLPLAFASGTGPNVDVEHEKEVLLTPGTYGAVKLGHESTLKLAPGKYTFASLRMEEKSKLFAERGGDHGKPTVSGVDLHIIGELWMEHHSDIAPHWDDAKAKDFTIEVAGNDPVVVTPGTRLTPTTIVSIGHESNLHALLAAPHGTVWMAEDVEVKGAVAAFDIITGEKVKAEFETGFPVSAPDTQGSQQLHGYYRMAPDSALAPLVGPVAQSDLVHLAIGLPARDPAGLQTLADQVSDPKNPNYRKYLSVNQFALTYGATAADYTALTLWAQAAGLHVDHAHANNLLLSVTGTAAQIQQALFTNLDYRLRADGTNFVTVDRDPSLNLAVIILRISGLNDAVPHRPKLHLGEPHFPNPGAAPPVPGSGPSGNFGGSDFRNAYAPGVTQTGTGQTVALFQFDGFYAADITAYEALFSLPNVPIKIQTENGVSSTPSSNATNVSEVSLDIEMAIAMAPGLDSVVVYEGNQANSILAAIAAPPTGVPLSNQVSTSWDYSIDDNTRQTLEEFAVQGQSFSDASGDNGAFPSDPGDDRDQPYTTLVGGTVLSMNGTGTSWQSETGWSGSGGGILTNLPIPNYQTPLNFSTDNGSTQFRNAPDIALVASGVWIIYNNGTSGPIGGTSVASPLWAGYLALVNQLAKKNGQGPVGWANPAIYTIGQNAVQYAADFNDITTGNNIVATANQFNAVAGFDLVTGWGSPQAPLVNDLSGVPASGTPLAIIKYHQVGACNGYVNSSGGVNAGPNAAFVVFAIESIDNSASLKNFAFDPGNLFVHQAVDNFMDFGLQMNTDILAPNVVGTTTVPKGTVFTETPLKFGPLVVQTVLADGSTEANQTAYFLRYKAAASDPTIFMQKTNALRTSWPNTQDCKIIVLN